MDSNKKRLLYFTLSLLVYGVNLSAQTVSLSGKVLSKSSTTPIEFASITLKIKDSLWVAGTLSDSLGCFEFDDLKSNDYKLIVSCVGFEQQEVLVQNLIQSVEVDISLIEDLQTLSEISVSASATIRSINRRIIFPTHLQLSHSISAFQLLKTMMLPGISVNPVSNEISSSGGGDIILQINGVEVTKDEIQILSAKEVKHIEYYDYAGIKYNRSSRIINFIVVRDANGVVVGLDLMNAVNTLAGGDVIFAKVNKGKSEYSLNYILAYQKNTGNNRSRIGTYHLDDLTINRKEVAAGGKYTSKIQDVVLGYNYQRNDSSFLNLKLKYNYINDPHNDFESIQSENRFRSGMIYDKVSQENNIPSVDMYYELGLKNQQRIYMNLVSSYSDATSTRHYSEYDNDEILFITNMRLISNKYSFIGEGVYEKNFDIGKLKLGIKHNQSFMRQSILQEESAKFKLDQAESSIFTEWIRTDRLSYALALRLNRLHYSSNIMNKDYFFLVPNLMIGYQIDETTLIRHRLELDQTNPTLVELNDVIIRVDPYILEQGNSNLNPYNNLINNLSLEKTQGIFSLDINLLHHYKHKPIMESKRFNGANYLITPNNMKSWNRYNLEVGLKAAMIKDFLQLSIHGGANYFKSRGNSYLHKHFHIYYKAELLAMYKKWMFVAQLQPYKESFYGETLIKDGNYHYFSLHYTTNNISLGIGAFNPFKNVSKSVIDNKNVEAPIRRVAYNNSSQTIVMTLTLNLNFGKTHDPKMKSLDNYDTDYGIKKAYK